MVWTELTEGLGQALAALGLLTPERLALVELAIPRERAHGDWTTNLPMILAREVGRPPRALAADLAAAFPADPERFSPVEVAGPGFLNCRHESWLRMPPSVARIAGATWRSRWSTSAPIRPGRSTW